MGAMQVICLSWLAVGLQKVKKQRADAKARKEENQRRSNITQTISSNATLRKMMKSKKQRKKLQKADTVGEIG